MVVTVMAVVAVVVMADILLIVAFPLSTSVNECNEIILLV